MCFFLALFKSLIEFPILKLYGWFSRNNYTLNSKIYLLVNFESLNWISNFQHRARFSLTKCSPLYSLSFHIFVDYPKFLFKESNATPTTSGVSQLKLRILCNTPTILYITQLINYLKFGYINFYNYLLVKQLYSSSSQYIND